MSNRVLLKKSSIAAKVPLVADLEYGELALNYTDGKLYYKTANNTVASLSGDNYVQIDRKSYTATAAQTTFSIAYIPPYVDVYINGVHMSDEDYTATSGTSIVLTQACSVGDQVDLMGFSGTLISTSQKTNGEVLVYNGTTGIWDNVAQSTLIAGNATKWATPRNLSLTGDATATLSSVDGSAAVSAALTLATVNSNVGTFGSSTLVPVITVNAKGLVTGVTTSSISGALTFTGDVTGSGTTGSSTVLTIAPLAVTNAMLAGSITNAKLSNSSVTVGTTAIALGASSTTLAGLTSVTSTSFTGALTGNASTATTLETARAIQGVNFDGSAAITVVTAGTGVSVSGTAVSIGQAIGTTDNVTFNNVTVNGTLTSDDITSTNISVAGNATITGNLIVSGTTTTINSTTIAIADLNLELARNATTAVQANGAGLTVIGPTTSATFTYTSADDRWNLNKDLNVTTVYGALSGNASTATALATGRTIAITGDIAYTSGSFDGTGNVTGTATLATVNSNTGAFGSTTASPVITVNAKGLVTAVSTSTITPAIGSITGLGTGVTTALGVNTGTAGAFVVNGGALGTPSSGTVTNLTGTASININGTVGATTASTGAFTTLSATGAGIAGGDDRIFTVTNTTANSYGAMTLVGTSRGGYINFYNGATAQASIVGQASALDIYAGSNSSGSLVARFSSTGAAVTGTLSATGMISTTVTNQIFDASGTSTSPRFGQIGNGSGLLTFGIEGSAGGALITGTSAYDTAFTSGSGRGIAFGVTSGAMYARLTSTALALQSGISLTGGTSGTGFSFSGSAPANSLTLASSGQIQGVLNNASVGNATSMQLTQNGAGDAAISFLIGATTEWLAGVDNSDSDSFKINNITGVGDFNNAGITLTTGGNLGIGTSSPSQKLTVNGVVASIGPATALTASSTFLDYNTTLNLGRFAAVGNTTGTAAPIYFSQYSSNGSVGRDAAIIDSSGNLGIGTSAPAARLDVAGSIGFTVGANFGIIRRTTVNGSNGIRIQGNANDTISDTNAGAYISIGGGVIGDTYEGNIDIVAYGSIVDANRNQIKFSNRSGTNTITERMRIDKDGNVGIGTSSPLTKFAVNGGTLNTTYTSSETRIFDGSIHLMKTSAGSIFEAVRAMNMDTTAGTTVRILAAASSDPFNNTNGGKVFIDAIRTSTNMDLAFSLNDAGGGAPIERVRFMGSGNVMIGTTTDSGHKLNVSGNINSTTGFKTASNSAASLANGAFNVAKTVIGGLHFNNGGGTSGAGNQAAITFMGSNADEAQAGIYVHNNSSDGTHMAFATTGSYATGPQIALSITNNGVVNFPRARPQWNGTNLVIASDVVSSITATTPIVASASTGAVTLSHAASGATAGTYNNVIVNTFGHVTSGSNVSYLTTEADTLATVTGRGNVATSHITLPASSANGYWFWGGTSTYGIRMGNDAEFHYGPVTDYSIKNSIDSVSSTRGFTWGVQGATPIAALNVGNGNMQIAGTFSALSKSFLIDHPTKPGMQLRYGSLEGPENGVYVRGRLRGNKIELPEYWTKLVDPDSITVNLTAIGKSQELYVEDIIDNVVYIGGKNVNCFYTVYAERVDIAKLEVEIG